MHTCVDICGCGLMLRGSVTTALQLHSLSHTIMCTFKVMIKVLHIRHKWALLGAIIILLVRISYVIASLIVLRGESSTLFAQVIDASTGHTMFVSEMTLQPRQRTKKKKPRTVSHDIRRRYSYWGCEILQSRSWRFTILCTLRIEKKRMTRTNF